MSQSAAGVTHGTVTHLVMYSPKSHTLGSCTIDSYGYTHLESTYPARSRDHTPRFTHIHKPHTRGHTHSEAHSYITQADWLTLDNHDQDTTHLDFSHSDASPSAAAHPLGLTHGRYRIDLEATYPVSHAPLRRTCRLLRPVSFSCSLEDHAHSLGDSHLLRYHRHFSHTTLRGPLLFIQMVPLLIPSAH